MTLLGILAFIQSGASSEIEGLPIDDVAIAPDGPASDALQKQAQVFLTLAWSHGESLRCGEYLATVSVEEGAHNPPMVVARINCKFDNVANRLRCDSTLQQDTFERRFVGLGTGSIIYESDKKWVHLSPEGGVSATSRAALWAIDPRSICWSSAQDQIRSANPYARLRDEVFTADNIVAIERLSPHLVELRWRPHTNVLSSVMLDESLDCVPVAKCMRYKTGDAGQFVPRELVISKWEALGKTLVPTHVKSEKLRTPGETTTIEFSWVSANRSLNEQEFTLEGMRLPPRTRVREIVRDTSKMVGLITETGKMIATNGDGLPIPPVIKAANWTTRRIMTVLAGLALAVAAWQILCFHRRSA